MTFREFCTCELGDWFPGLWTPIQLTVASEIDEVVAKGTRCFRSLNRGEGKTTLCAAAALFAAKQNHVVALIARSNAAAKTLAEMVLSRTTVVLPIAVYSLTGSFRGMPRPTLMIVDDPYDALPFYESERLFAMIDPPSECLPRITLFS